MKPTKNCKYESRRNFQKLLLVQNDHPKNFRNNHKFMGIIMHNYKIV